MNVEPPPLPSDQAPVSAAYKDRSNGLVVFGILTLLLGVLAGLLVPFVLYAQTVVPKAPNSPPGGLAITLSVVFFYGMLAITLGWLGIGSMMARRWARALLLIFSWYWLIMGTISALITPFALSTSFANPPPNSTVGQSPMPPGFITGMIVGISIFLGFFFVLLPALWVCFYRSRHVKATCEARDPHVRWTDACPLPVLAVSIGLALAVPMMLIMPLTTHAVMPFFGMLLNGPAAVFFCVVMAAVQGTSARWLYRLDPRGWWLTVVMAVVLTVSSLMTFAQHDMTEMYRLMNYSQAQIDQIQKTGFLTSAWSNWMTGLSGLAYLTYMLWIKKYFPKRQTPAAG